PISNISLFTEKPFVTVSENKSALVQCVCHGGIPAGQITWFYNKVLPYFVEITHPRTQFVTAYEDKIVYFECVTSPGYPASVITWYKLTNRKEVITNAGGSSTTEMKDRTIVTRSWVSLTFSISDDWTFVYCTANNSAGTLTSRNRAAVHVHKVT
ncbi:hypothetical protein MAR_032297, partial [Mya arenaria]